MLISRYHSIGVLGCVASTGIEHGLYEACSTANACVRITRRAMDQDNSGANGPRLVVIFAWELEAGVFR